MHRILVLTNNDMGLYKFRKELIQELVKQNEVYLALPYGEFAPRLKEMGCRLIDTPIDRRGANAVKDLMLLMKYVSIIKEVKPDVVLTYTVKPNVYGGLACRITHTPYIVNITGLGSALENGGVIQKTLLILCRIALNKASCIFFQNKENRHFFNGKNIICGTHKLIPGSGVNLEHYRVLDYPKENKIRFLFIARIMKEKGIDQYLEAARYIKGKYPNTEFHILGFCEEGYEERLKKMMAQGIIQYHGMQSDIREYHKFSHCTIHPTYYPEGMSNVLLESAACGRPVITTNRSGCREIVDDGVNGYIVQPQNSQDLIEKVERFLSLTNKQKTDMGLAGRTKVENEFDRRIVVNAYLEQIEKAIDVKNEMLSTYRDWSG